MRKLFIWSAVVVALLALAGGLYIWRLQPAAGAPSPALRIPRNRMTHDGRVSCVAYSPDGKTLASSGGVTILLWDVSPEK